MEKIKIVFRQTMDFPMKNMNFCQEMDFCSKMDLSVKKWIIRQTNGFLPSMIFFCENCCFLDQKLIFLQKDGFFDKNGIFLSQNGSFLQKKYFSVKKWILLAKHGFRSVCLSLVRRSLLVSLVNVLKCSQKLVFFVFKCLWMFVSFHLPYFRCYSQGTRLLARSLARSFARSLVRSSVRSLFFVRSPLFPRLASHRFASLRLASPGLAPSVARSSSLLVFVR